MRTVNKIFVLLYTINGYFFNQSIFNVLLLGKNVGEIWNHHLDENNRLEFHISSLRLNLLYRGKIIVLCLWHLLWNQHQAIIVACHLCSVLIQYQYVYHMHYCSKDRHHYSSCCHCCYFRGDCFCCCYCRWECVWQGNLNKGKLRLHNNREEILSFGTTWIDWRQHDHNWKTFCC